MLKSILRSFFVVSRFSYVIFSVLILLIVLIALNVDGLSLGDLGILIVLIAVFGLIWWRLHARESDDLPVNATALLRAAKHSHKHALLVFESEFSLFSMIFGVSAARLEATQPKDFNVYRVSVIKEPGRTLFSQFEGRLTPAYVLIDPKGNKVGEWTFALPTERVKNAITSQQPT